MNRAHATNASRRSWLRSMAAGSMLMPGLLSQLMADEAARDATADPLAPKATHFPARAKRVIFLFMSGGVSHVDSWDYKPKLIADAGKTVSVNEFQGRKGQFNMFLKRPQWDFTPHGESGTYVSSLFPHMAQCVDDLCLIRSMKSDHTNHYEATLGIHTGSFTFARPSIGLGAAMDWAQRIVICLRLWSSRRIRLMQVVRCGAAISCLVPIKARWLYPAPNRWPTFPGERPTSACKNWNWLPWRA